MNLVRSLAAVVSIGLSLFSYHANQSAPANPQVLGETETSVGRPIQPPPPRPTLNPTQKAERKLRELEHERETLLATPSPRITKRPEPTRRPTITDEKRKAYEKMIEEKKRTLETKKKEIEEEHELRKQEEEQKREAYKARLAEIKNQKKKASVEKIDAKLAEINANATKHMEDALSKLSSAAASIDLHLQELSKTSDTTTAQSLLATARAAILDTQTLLVAQKAKTYTLQLPEDEAQLKTTVGTTVSGMQQDLKQVRDALAKAKDAMVAAYKEAFKQSITPPISITTAPVL
jgi:hypothetical protein